VPVVADRAEDESCRAGVGVTPQPPGSLRRCARDRKVNGVLGRDAEAVRPSRSTSRARSRLSAAVLSSPGCSLTAIFRPAARISRKERDIRLLQVMTEGVSFGPNFLRLGCDEFDRHEVNGVHYNRRLNVVTLS
jgi:hypothetical protein